MKILASSRERLHVTGETTYQVPSLSFPERHEAVTLDALKRYEAVRLFIERAVAVQSAFQVTNENANAVSSVPTFSIERRVNQRTESVFP